MLIADTHCHVGTNWYEPVETLLYLMAANGVDKALLVQGVKMCIYDNSYLIESIRRYPGRFSAIGKVDTDRSDAPDQLEQLVKQGIEGVRLKPMMRSPGTDPLAIWRKAAQLGIPVSVQGAAEQIISAEFREVITSFPTLNLIIEHLGNCGSDTAP